MALLNTCGFETGSDTYEPYSTINGTGSIQSSVKRSGNYALKINPTASSAGSLSIAGYNATDGTKAVLNVATAYYRFYFKAELLPASGSEEIFVANYSSGAKLGLRITSTGNLQVYDNTLTNKLGSDGATSLQANRWYRIEVSVGTGASASYEVEINGNSELSGTGNLHTSNNAVAYLGKVNNRNNNSVIFYYDDFAVDGAAFPGSGRVRIMTPNTDGNYTTWTIGAGAGDKWQQVDDNPPDLTSYLISTLTSTNAYTAALISTATAGISGTIYGATALVIVDRDGAAGVAQMRIRVRGGTTDADTGTNVIPGTGTFTVKGKIQNTNPATGAAWTTAGLDGAEVGAVERSTTQKTRLAAAYLMVDYNDGLDEFPTEVIYGPKLQVA